MISVASADLPVMVAQSRYSLFVLLALGCLLFFHYFDNKSLADELTDGLPLSRAAFRGNPIELEAALRKGFNPNEQDLQGNTPLHWATSLEAHQRFPQADHEGCARRLLAAGANVKAINRAEETPLYRAVWNPRFTDMLLEDGADPNQGAQQRTPLMSASYLGGPLCADAVRSMQSLVRAGANVNAQESSGFSALTSAAIYGCPEMVRFLLASGADPNARTRHGETVLATMRRFDKIAQAGIITRIDYKVRDINASLIRNAGGRE